MYSKADSSLIHVLNSCLKDSKLMSYSTLPETTIKYADKSTKTLAESPNNDYLCTRYRHRSQTGTKDDKNKQGVYLAL